MQKASAGWTAIVRSGVFTGVSGRSLSDCLQLKIGDGRTTCFWLDIWSPAGRLMESYPRLFRLSLFQDASMSVVHQEHLLLIPAGWRHALYAWEIEQCQYLHSLFHALSFGSGVPDKWSWVGNDKDSYSVQAGYRLLNHLPPPAVPCPLPWRPNPFVRCVMLLLKLQLIYFSIVRLPWLYGSACVVGGVSFGLCRRRWGIGLFSGLGLPICRLPASLDIETALEFTTYGVTKKSYTKFVSSLRNQLTSDYKRHGIPVLPQPSRVADGERFLLVKLSNSPEVCISLALDVTDANVVGYQAGVESYFFSNAPNLAFSDIFAKTQKKKLPLGITYPELEKAAGANRQGIDLGISNLDGAITTLYQSNGSPANSVASALIVVMQMITEAARFRCMELQRAFFNAVPLRRANGEIYYAYSVSDTLRANLALLKFVCTSTEHTSASSSSPSYLRQVISDYDVPCPALEPTLKIMGRDALCVAAHNYSATDGNPVILFDCGVNHFWTFKRDGTIRYKDQCLTTYNFGPESNKVIYNCSTAPKSTTIWVMDTNGSIVNPYSGWSLTSVLPTKATKLTIEKTSLVSSQGWYPTNNTQILY
ncbi:hypothetical protein Tsubulata_027934, partial [Turnera subulata]